MGRQVAEAVMGIRRRIVWCQIQKAQAREVGEQAE